MSLFGLQYPSHPDLAEFQALKLTRNPDPKFLAVMQVLIADMQHQYRDAIQSVIASGSDGVFYIHSLCSNISQRLGYVNTVLKAVVLYERASIEHKLAPDMYLQALKVMLVFDYVLKLYLQDTTCSTIVYDEASAESEYQLMEHLMRDFAVLSSSICSCYSGYDSAQLKKILGF